ncbi:hypothetical protein [Bradyrhizobium sp. WSM471]|uniref:hypothetical protein n=1 Tax=Bradyrhizobium sp. WSM471 TaxID=319017 RepID=UPI00055A4E7E|nr:MULTISPECIES: hypothetical protein [Bradyrhizobium]UFW39768.1 hypothetical protein BcanWSM471_26605 [Bradyrhizobium canariense]
MCDHYRQFWVKTALTAERRPDMHAMPTLGAVLRSKAATILLLLTEQMYCPSAQFMSILSANANEITIQLGPSIGFHI